MNQTAEQAIPAAVTGTALQAMVRNVLADPYLLGVGTALGASSLTGSAFIGALGSMAAVFALARIGGRVTSIRLLLGGVAVGCILSATTSFMIFISGSGQGARDVLFWLLGSLTLAIWSSVAIAGLVVVATIAGLLLWARRLVLVLSASYLLGQAVDGLPLMYDAIAGAK